MLLTIFIRGDWQGVKFCDEGMAICGLRVRMDTSKDLQFLMEDDTALNGAKFKCCPLLKFQNALSKSCFTNKPSSDYTHSMSTVLPGNILSTFLTKPLNGTNVILNVIFFAG